MEGLIFRRASIWREICVSKSIGLAGSGKEIYHFCFVLTLYSRANFKYKPPGGAYIRRGNLTVDFLRYDFGGLIFGGAYTWRGLFSEFYGMLVTDLCAYIISGWLFTDKNGLHQVLLFYFNTRMEMLKGRKSL